MGHHGRDNPEFPFTDDKAEAVKEQLEKAIGKQGTFPEGKLTEGDEGAIAFGITHLNGKVVLNFGTTITWLGMAPAQAKILASHLIKHANDARLIKGRPKDEFTMEVEIK